MEAVQTLGFFGSRKVVWFRDVGFLVDNAQGKSERVKERIGDLAALIKGGLAPEQVLVVSASKVDKRYAFYKACKAAGEIHEFKAPEKAYLAEQEARSFLREQADTHGLKLTRASAEVFLSRVGTESRQICNEVEKLAIYAGPGAGAVTPEEVTLMTCVSRDVPAWDLVDAFGERDLVRCIEVLRQLLFRKESPVGLIIALESRIRDLSLYREALDQGWLRLVHHGRGVNAEWGGVPPETEQAFEAFARDPRKAHPFYAGKLAGQAESFTAAQLTNCRDVILDAHRRFFSSAVPQDVLLELALVKMLT
jgi:DNA polymerase-3 subunit delta